jgi:hypothetical protein
LVSHLEATPAKTRMLGTQPLAIHPEFFDSTLMELRMDFVAASAAQLEL